MNKKPKKLLDANTAVASYLDNLLQEATEPDNEISQKKVVEHHNVHVLETPLTAAKQFTKDDIIQSSLTEVIEDKIEPELKIESELEIDIELDVESAVEPEKITVNVKEQLKYPVQCLMFKVKGHLLAVPLMRMGSVVPFAERLTQLPHSPSYFKGLLKHREKNVRVADTASLLLNNAQKMVDGDEFSPSHLLVFEHDDWAISCDELLDVVTLNEEDIKWHTEANRLSLGTIKSSLAMILNPEAIIQQLTKENI